MLYPLLNKAAGLYKENIAGSLFYLQDVRRWYEGLNGSVYIMADEFHDELAD